MTLHKQKLLNDFKCYNLPKEIIKKIESDDINVYDSYLLIISYIHSSTKEELSI